MELSTSPGRGGAKTSGHPDGGGLGVGSQPLESPVSLGRRRSHGPRKGVRVIVVLAPRGGTKTSARRGGGMSSHVARHIQVRVFRQDRFRSVPFGEARSRPGWPGDSSRGGCFGSTSISATLGGRG